ncbi:CDP-glycerol glycerophosphotransferase family protein [Lactiplantibacillus sp. WILCCON 0030]|uniref:CDP-glycerol glycerophosphotransferase family protein n=1 Tax=Lactiplantibacillus brownii TaxID=3069269 RepID=A0ABU1A6K5_9LACO|nr:CDP-glycerol glycerophosphotransferase family protein [Lactiplantibacillus brownii]MDQ7936082.1 CDP-glycerol glycerophosphotransferase family protein [Lactiplantibacillus brownii]
MSLIERVTRVMTQRRLEQYKYTYLKYYKKHRKYQNTVLVESTHGDGFYGHMFYVVKEIRASYAEMKVYVAVNPEKLTEVKAILQRENIEGVQLVPYLSNQYGELLACAEYLFNDTSFYDFFIKQDFQKYFNIWHGTPLKCLGKDDGDVAGMGNVQKNFYAADALVVSNDYTRDKMIQSFNLDRVMRGDVLVSPSPRNSILGDQAAWTSIRKQYQLENKEALVYMPTWRGDVVNVNSDVSSVVKLLTALDTALADDQVLFVKLHPFQAKLAKLDFSQYQHIVAFPTDVESYMFLAGTDALITDYSSIMYDYMNTRKPVALYVYDKKNYYASRGCYEDIDDYPFTQAHNVQALCDWVSSHHKAIDYSDDFANRYVGADSETGTKELVAYLFTHYGNGEAVTTSNISALCPYNGKETVAIYSGPLWNNGITTALLNTLNNVDVDARNYVVFFQKSSVNVKFTHVLFNLPKGVTFYPVPGGVLGDTFERFAVRRYIRSEHFKLAPFSTATEKVYRREYRRILGGLDPDYLIHYTGFERGYSEMIASLRSERVKTAIFVHTDMFEERKLRGKGLNWKMTARAYKYADKVVLVSEELRQDFVAGFPDTANKITIVDNFLGSETVQQAAEESGLTAIIEGPVTYSNNSRAEEAVINSLGGNHVNFAMPAANDFVGKVLLTRYAQRHQFKHVEQALPAIQAAINTKMANYVQLKAPIDFSTNDLYAMYGVSKLRLLDDLLNKQIKVFINVGRMAEQKGHDRLINSFVEVHKQYPNTRLVIVAPHGDLRRETIQWIRDSGCSGSIYLLGSMDNPYSLMKMADAFVFTSRFEGLGLVVFEALALDMDVITVNLPETVAMLEPGNAMIAENDDAAITKTWLAYMQHGFERKPFNFAIHNDSSVAQFEQIFK